MPILDLFSNYISLIEFIPIVVMAPAKKNTGVECRFVLFNSATTD